MERDELYVRRGGDQNARHVAELQAQHHHVDHLLLIAHVRDLIDRAQFALRTAQGFRLFTREEHAHRPVGPLQPSLR